MRHVRRPRVEVRLVIHFHQEGRDGTLQLRNRVTCVYSNLEG